MCSKYNRKLKRGHSRGIFSTIKIAMKNKDKKIIALIILTLIFVVIAILIATGHAETFDNGISKFIQTHVPKSLDRPFNIITFLGGTKIMPVIVVITALVLCLLKKQKASIMILSNSLVNLILYTSLKNIFQRPRPTPFYLIKENGYSFPSGHASSSMAFCGLLIYFACKHIKNKKIKIVVVTILSLWILTIGITRIYFNVHYPSDIIAGFALGGICILSTVIISEKRMR